MTAEEGLDIGKGDGCCFVDHYQVTVSDLIRVVGEDELYELSMALEDIDAQYCTIVILIVTEDTLEVHTLLEVQQLKTLAYELEECFKVIGRRRSYKDVTIAELHRTGYGKTD